MQQNLLVPQERKRIMEIDKNASPKSIIHTDDLNPDFASEVRQHSGVEFSTCYHCSGCIGICPFSHAMDYPPNRMIRLVQLGMKKEALESSAIWLCVGCHTCSHHCPMLIDMSAIMDSLRQIALEEGKIVAEPDILNFHRDVLHSINRYGRTHELEIMLRYKARNWDWFTDLIVGAKMFTKGKLHIKPSKIKAIDRIRATFDPNKDVVVHE